MTVKDAATMPGRTMSGSEPATAMQLVLYAAVALTIGVGIAHSYLGERFILMRLFRREEHLPKVFGSTRFTTRTLRFAWHLTTVAWWGFAAILLALADRPPTIGGMGMIVGCTFLAHSAVTLFASRGRHMAWPVFLAIGIFSIYATRTLVAA